MEVAFQWQLLLYTGSTFICTLSRSPGTDDIISEQAGHVWYHSYPLGQYLPMSGMNRPVWYEYNNDSFELFCIHDSILCPRCPSSHNQVAFKSQRLVNSRTKSKVKDELHIHYDYIWLLHHVIGYSDFPDNYCLHNSCVIKMFDTY